MSRALLLLTPLFVLAACGGDEALHGTKPSVSLGLEAIEFGDVPAGATKMLDVPVSNLGEGALRVCVADDDGTAQASDPVHRCGGLTRIVPNDGTFATQFDGVDPKTGMW